MEKWPNLRDHLQSKWYQTSSESEKMKNSHILNHSSYIPDILEYDCDFHQKKTYTAAKCLKIQNQNSESAFYISCTTHIVRSALVGLRHF